VRLTTERLVLTPFDRERDWPDFDHEATPYLVCVLERADLEAGAPG
jgi:hypothetical protein